MNESFQNNRKIRTQITDEILLEKIWLSIRDDYRTLIGLDILGVVERYDDNEGVENSDV